MKYSELNGRNLEPWSLRQLGFYHQFDTNTKKSVFVLLLPGLPSKSIALERVRDALTGVSSLTDFTQLYLRLNAAILGCYINNWRDCMRYYELRFQELANTTMAPGLIVNKSVTAEHLATLHFLHTRILPLYSAFLYLEQTISMLRKIKVAVGQPNAPDNVTIKPQEQFGDVSATMHSYKTNASALLKRWTVTVDMVNTALNLTDQKLAREQNGLVTALGKFTASDSASIHVITIITLVFLCFTVVSGVLDMPFFFLDAENNLQTAVQLWIFPAVSVPLTLACVGYWRWQVWKRKGDQDKIVKKHMDDMV